MLITLDRWAERYDPPPKKVTLWRWAREGKIVPLPRKHGRTYYVQADAKHVAEATLGGAIRGR